MITKYISLATGIATVDVYLRSQQSSNDPIFAVVSSNLAINIIMVALAALAIGVSFRGRFGSWTGYAMCSILAVILTLLGGAGVIFSGVTNYFWMIFLPMNYMFMLSTGIVLGIASLSYNHAPRPARYQLPRPARPSWFAFPVPKTLHPPLLRFDRSVTDSQ